MSGSIAIGGTLSGSMGGAVQGLTAGGIDASNFASESAQGRIHGLACAFFVQVGGTNNPGNMPLSLGWWTNCSGLKLEWKFQDYNEGGRASSSGSFPLRVTWSKITLKRGMTRLGWNQVREWLADVVANPSKTYPGHITLYDAWAQPVAQWDLEGVFPASWQGPDMDADSKKVAYETLTLSHNGFLGAAATPR